MGSPKKPTDSAAPLTDPWFEDSQPFPAPELDPKPDNRERKERTQIPKVIVSG
jgi:hypothetical protein